MTKHRNKTLKVLIISVLTILGLVAVSFCIYIGMILSALGLFDKTYNTNDLIENFNKKRIEIYDVKNYVNKIAPQYKKVAIGFKDDVEIARLDIIPLDTGKGTDLTGFTDWNLKIKSKKVDSLLHLLNWNATTLQTIKEKLDNANCISIESGEPAKIGFQRSGMGMYFFNVFDKPMPDAVKNRYNDSCLYIYVNRELVLEYGGGAIGPQCFPMQKPDTKSK